MLIGLTVFFCLLRVFKLPNRTHQKGSLKTPNPVFRLPWH